MNNNNIWTPGSIHGDEYYTLERVARQISNNIIDIPKLKVWLPFNDAEWGVWDRVLTYKGFKTVCTPGDFFETEPPEDCQAIISNPPFSVKKDVLERIKELDLRFVLILPFTWMNDCIPMEYGHQIMLFRQRMHFDTPEGDLNKPRSNCFVLSDGLLKTDMKIVWEKGY